MKTILGILGLTDAKGIGFYIIVGICVYLTREEEQLIIPWGFAGVCWAFMVINNYVHYRKHNKRR